MRAQKSKATGVYRSKHALPKDFSSMAQMLQRSQEGYNQKHQKKWLYFFSPYVAGSSIKESILILKKFLRKVEFDRVLRFHVLFTELQNMDQNSRMYNNNRRKGLHRILKWLIGVKPQKELPFCEKALV